MPNETPLCSIKIADQNYVINMTGDQIVEALRRMLEFDSSLVGTIRLESTKDNPCNLDLLRDIGDYFIDYTANGPTAADDAVGVQVRVCEINGVTHQILYIKDDIYVRAFDPNTNKYDQWDKFSYGTTVYDGNVPPGSVKIGTLWVDTSGALPALKRYNGKEWVNFSPVGPGELSKFNHNTVLLTNDVSIVPTGLPAYDRSKGHLLMCFINSTLMVESTDYIVMNDGIHIRRVDGTWRGTPLKPITFSFYLFVPGMTGAYGEGGMDPSVLEEFEIMKEQLAVLYKYLDALRKQLGELDGSLVERVEEIEKKIEDTNKAIEDTNKEIQDLKDSIKDSDDRIKDLEDNQKDMLEKIELLQKIVEEGGGSWLGDLPDGLVYYRTYGDNTDNNGDTPENTPSGDSRIRSKAKARAGATTSLVQLPDNLVYYVDPSGEIKTL